MRTTELKLENGRYVARAAGGFETVGAAAETVQRLMMRLAARRGGFCLLPEYGSALHTLGRVRPSLRRNAARQMVYEALLEETGVTIGEVDYAETGDGSAAVTVELTIPGGESARLTVRTGGDE